MSEPFYADDSLYWAFNLPLQMWDGDNGWQVLNYMPRRERCEYLDERVPASELKPFCTKAASVLRNLADLFEALGDRKIDHVYYPDQLVEEAIAQAEHWRKEKTNALPS